MASPAKGRGFDPVSRSSARSQQPTGMWKNDPAHAHPVSPNDDDFLPVPDFDVPDGVTSLGRTISIKGDLTAGEHLIIEGRFEGQLAVPEHGLAVGQHAEVTAEILARTITILGHANGSLTAAEKVEIRQSGSVEGRIVAQTVAIEEGAHFKGSIDPTRTDAALAVGRHRLKQRVHVERPHSADR